MKLFKELTEGLNAPRISVKNLKKVKPGLSDEVEVTTLRSGTTYILGSEDDIKMLVKNIDNVDYGYSTRFGKHYLVVK